MARLLVEAVSSEGGFMDDPWAAGVGVSVSRADDGTPVTGLSKENFRVASTEGWVDWAEYVHEMKWETADIEPSGCYDVGIYKTPPQGLTLGVRYVFGIQVRTFITEKGKRPLVVDQGQTIVEVTMPEPGEVVDEFGEGSP